MSEAVGETAVLFSLFMSKKHSIFTFCVSAHEAAPEDRLRRIATPQKKETTPDK